MAEGQSVGKVYVDVIPRYAGGGSEIGERIGRDVQGAMGGGGGGGARGPSGDSGGSSSATMRYAASLARFESGRVAQLDTLQRMGEFYGGDVGLNAQSSALIGRSGIQERVDRSWDMAQLAQQKAGERQVSGYRDLFYSTQDKLRREAEGVATRVDRSWDMAALSSQKEDDRNRARARREQVSGYRDTFRETSRGLQQRDRQYQGYRDTYHETVERLAADDARDVSARGAQHQGYRDLFHETTRNLQRSDFEDSLFDMGPNGRRRALTREAQVAANAGDPMRATQLSRQADRLKRFTGLNTQLFSTGQYMNLLFGGMEIFHAAGAFQRAGAETSPQAQYDAYLKSADTVSGGFLGSFAGMLTGSESRRAYATAPARSAELNDAVTAARGEKFQFDRDIARQGALAMASGTNRERMEAKYDYNDRGRKSQEMANGVYNAVVDAQRDRRSQIESDYKLDLVELGGGDDAERDSAVSALRARRGRDLAGLDDAARLAKQKSEREAGAGNDQLYLSRLRTIGQLDDTRKLVTQYHRDISAGRNERSAGRDVIAGRRRIAALSGDQAAYDDADAELGAYDYETPQIERRRLRAGAGAFGTNVGDLAAGAMVTRALLNRDPGGAQRAALRFNQQKRRNANPLLTKLGVMGLMDSGESALLDQQLGDDKSLLQSSLRNRLEVSGILARDDSPLRGLRANLAGTVGVASLEAEAYVRRLGTGGRDSASLALEIGRNTIAAARSDYLSGFSAVQANPNTSNISGGNRTTDLKDVLSEFQKATAKLDETNSKLDRIIDNTGDLGKAQ